MTDAEMLSILERGMRAAADVLVERVEQKQCSAADIAQLRAMYKDAGGAMTFNSRPTELGDSVLASMKDIDLDMLN